MTEKVEVVPETESKGAMPKDKRQRSRKKSEEEKPMRRVSLFSSVLIKLKQWNQSKSLENSSSCSASSFIWVFADVVFVFLLVKLRSSNANGFVDVRKEA